MKPGLTRLLRVSTTGILLIATHFVLGSQILGPTPAPPEMRYNSHLSTDKPIYRAGEKVYVRSVVLSQDRHLPMTSTGNASFEIKGPKGETVASGFTAIADSVAGFSWAIPAGQPGGEYTIRLLSPWDDTPVERKFDVRAYRAPRLKTQIAFVRDGYGPADTVAASLHVERAEGGVPVGRTVSVHARVDGEDVWNGVSRVDGAGNASTSFKLPAEIARGEGVLVMTIDDGGIVETATKTIPILLQTVDISLYPEGGDLIAGLVNRVYIQGLTPNKKPADMTGVIVTGGGREVARFRTEHEGRGRFAFTPLKGETYSLRVLDPSGIKKTFPLPAIRESGVTISSPSDIIASTDDVTIRLAASAEESYGVALSQHGKELSFKTIKLKAAEPANVTFTLPRSAEGVIVATVFDKNKKPIAERLLFRQPEHRVNVHIDADRKDYVPGDKVTLRVTTTDETGKPVGAVVGLTVTDSSVLEMIEKREQAPRLPVMVLLEGEVKDLADAQVYLDDANPKAPLATDLLLGTQGWRRFTTVGLGSLTGVVTDASRALIPGVTVAAFNTATQVTRTAVTNENGAYAFSNIGAGMYRVSATLPGFQRSTIQSVPVSSATATQRNFLLHVASVASMVEVRAVEAFAAVPVGGAVAGQVLPQQPIRDLPLVGNDVLDVIRVLPGVAAAPPPAGLFNEIQLKDEKAINRIQGGGRGGGKGAPNDLVTIREYAHVLRNAYSPDSRVDFAETVYWNAGLKTNASDGRATVSFNLSDSVTAFRVLADAFSHEGSLGSGTSEIESVQPFSIEPKLPLQVTAGDVIQLPVGIVNGMNTELRGAEITPRASKGLKFTTRDDATAPVRAKERARRVLQIEVGQEATGVANLVIDAKAGLYRDTVTRTLDVRPLGFPRNIANSGILDRNSTKTFEFALTGDIVPGSVVVNASVYPSPLANMTDALKALIHEPYGCFEQTSSTSYPMVMAQQYFLTHSGVEPALIEKTRSLLDVSYKKLLGFRSQHGGYEWFGADPGHEALTAYGLMQFTDMAQVRDVDKNMLENTRSWLLSRRDGQGAFALNPRALDSFGGAPAETTKAYITWALVEAGEKGLEKEIASVKATARDSQDSYIVALAANILHATGDRAGARDLMQQLVQRQAADGRVGQAVTSITRSGGAALNIETTALAVLAWLREPAFASNAERGSIWIHGTNNGGRFSSTQATILALRSIVAYDKAHARPKAPGRIILSIDGNTEGEPISFDANSKGVFEFPEIHSKLGPGKHTVALKMSDGSAMPFSISVRYYNRLPESSPESKVGIQVSLKNPRLEEGAVTEANVHITNRSDRAVPTPVAIVGIPGGLEVRHDQLKELVKSGKIDAYEVVGSDVVLYWRYLNGNQNVDLPLSLVAAIPGSYTGAASRAYLYYTDEYKDWTPGLSVNISRR